MNCREIKDLIQLYIDSELDSRSTLDVQRHIESCSGCSSVLENYVGQDQLLRQAAAAENVETMQLRKRILASVSREAPARTRGWLYRPIWRRTAVAAILVASAMALYFQADLVPTTRSSVYAAIVADHDDHCSVEASEGAASDLDELSRLISAYGRVKVPDLSRHGYENPTGRVCRVARKEFLHLVYHGSNLPPVSLFFGRRISDAIAEQRSILDSDGYRVGSFSRSGTDVLIVSSVDRDLLDDITGTVAELFSALEEG